ncbi:MAG: hypothetical protein ACI9YU_000639 [Flavobacteriales bacterium]|jgi:hypothetical protein
MLSNPVSKLIALAAIIICSFQAVSAQNITNNVGIGTVTPEPSAVLDVSTVGSPTLGVLPKGILVPRLNQIQRDLMETYYNDTLPDGLMIYETDEGKFWYYRHDSPQPATVPFGEWVEMSIAGGVNNSMPQGGIIMWSGTNASIPVGWNLCDGSNGTPDLTDKFVVSVANAGENPGLTTQGVSVVNTIVSPDKRFYKVAFIQKL